MKIKVNDNLTNIFNYIQANPEFIEFHDLVQYAIDYDLYREFYLNQQIIFRLLDEHNRKMKGDVSSEKTSFDYL